MKRQRGLVYCYSLDVLKKYRRLSPQQRLEWLEAINKFVAKVASKRIKKYHRLFRKGAI